MLELISCLRALPDKRQVWGLTSIGRLCLLAQDTYKSPWFVIVAALDSRNYFIEYRMPDDIAPWPGAYVKGEAQTKEHAIQMILTATEQSQGWKCPKSHA